MSNFISILVKFEIFCSRCADNGRIKIHKSTCEVYSERVFTESKEKFYNNCLSNGWEDSSVGWLCSACAEVIGENV